MSRFLEIGEIIEIITPKANMPSVVAPAPVSIPTPKVTALPVNKGSDYTIPIIIGALVIVGVIYLIKIEDEKSANTRYKL